MREIKEIIIHCTATPLNKKVTVASIHKEHCKRGFDGIGYHFVIDYDGNIYDGRDIEKPGAHCEGHNANSIGIAYIGGLGVTNEPLNTMTDEQIIALILMLKMFRKQYPGIEIHGHNEYSNKACPCFDVQEFLKENGL